MNKLTKEEALEMLKTTIKIYEQMANDEAGQEFVEAFKMSVEALENQTSVIAEVEKIKAEIDKDWQLQRFPSAPFSCGLRRATEILDNHIAELKGE